MRSPKRPRLKPQWWVVAGWVAPEHCHLTNAPRWRARAYIRHHLTGYHDALNDLATEDSWDDEYLYRQIKADAQHDVDEFLAKHRRPTT